MKKQQSNQQRLIIPSNGEMYDAIGNRDQSYDGVFFYGVVTTGVYCRPSCAARLANPENVRYFSDAESAGQAGFRPCKRCKPDNHGRDVERLIDVARYINTHSDEKLTLASLSKQVNLSPTRFQKSFKAAFGVSPKEFQDAARLGLLKTALKDGDGVTGAIFSAGFGSTSRVYGEAARNMGMTPAAYRAGGAGEKIFYASRSTSLGPLLMAATERGVCFAQFGERIIDDLSIGHFQFNGCGCTGTGCPGKFRFKRFAFGRGPGSRLRFDSQWDQERKGCCDQGLGFIHYR